MKMENTKGYSLIEILIALAIVAIVSSIAINSYQRQTLKTKRSVAKFELSKISMAQERFFSNNNTYTNDLSDLFGYTTTTVTTRNGLYTISAAAGTSGTISTSFVLTATPLGNQLQDDCASMTLDSAGIKSFTLKTGANAAVKCW
jgi:type IV pilus assembly protein PilE